MELALGTVQFGMAYGIAGRGSPVPESEVREILETACAAGIRLLDTAASYGDIEARLVRLCSGMPFQVISKIPALDRMSAGISAAELASDAAARSRDRLGGMLAGMLFHRAEDLLCDEGPGIWESVRRVLGSDVRLGVSCYAPEEACAIRARLPLSIAQLPGNALDQRIGNDDVIAQLERVELYVRSVFLQGLLLMPLEEAIRKVPAAAMPLRAWQRWCRSSGMSPLEGALAVAKSLSPVKYLIIGVDSVRQLDQIVSAWRSTTPATVAELACADPNVFDPRRWSVP